MITAKQLTWISFVALFTACGSSVSPDGGDGSRDGQADGSSFTDTLLLPDNAVRDSGFAPDATDTSLPTDDSALPDVPKPLDVPFAVDVPVVPDVPVPIDVPIATDVPVGVDVPTVTDVPTATDVLVPTDVTPPSDPCAPSAVVNLNTAGTLAGSTTTYNGNSTSTLAMAIIPAVCASPAHEVVHSYTARTMSTLRVSTDNTGTPSTLDTIVWILNTCATTGTTSYGCNDDVGSGTRNYSSTVTSNMTIPAGTTVYIVVAGYSPPVGSNMDAGPYELTVTELTQVVVGGMCDPMGALNVCVTGSSCVTAAGASTCVADGSAGGRCLGGGTCNTGLGCSSTNHCVATVPDGVACDPMVVTNVCASGGSHCVTNLGASVCVPDGTSGGRCRSGGAACDPGLACNGPVASASSRCRPVIADGAPCDPTGVANTCASPTAHCVTNSGTSTCIQDGTAGGLCRSSGAAACNTSLACSGSPMSATSRCRAQLADGAACDPTGVMNICTPPALCIPSGGGFACHQSYLQSPSAAAFIDACATGTHVTTGSRDDGTTAASLPLPISFAFYGTPYTEFWPDTNGYVVFGATAATNDLGGAGTIPRGGEGPTIAALWDDLVLNTAPASDICTFTTGVAPSRHFAIEWLDASRYNHAMVHLTFEIVLNEGTNTIDLLYQTLNPTSGADQPFANGTNATIGVQSTAGADYTIHSGALTAPTGIRFTPN